MLKNVVWSLSLVTCCWVSAENALEQRSFAMQECIQMALQHNLDLQIERLSPEISKYNLNAAYGMYDPQFKFTALRDVSDIPGQIDYKKENPDNAYDLKTSSMESQFTGQLLMGMNYKLSGYADYMDAKTFFPTLPGFDPIQRITNQTAAGWNLTLSQPLLKDFWIDKDRLKIKVNKQNLKIAELALRQEIMNVVTRVKNTYCDLIFAREQIGVYEKALELATLLVKETTRKAELGEASQLDAMKAQAQAETIQTDLQKARQFARDTANKLKSLMNDDFKSWSGMEIYPTDKMGAVAFVFNREDSWAKAMSKRPDLLQFRSELVKSDCMVQFGFNQLFPSLNAFGSYGSRAVGPSFDSAANMIGDERFPSFSYGLVMSVPLTRTAERNNYKASKVARQKAELQLKKLEQAILVQVENAGIQIETTQERLKSARKAREYAELALNAEQKKLAVGESTSYVVLQMQRDLTRARSEEIETIAEFNKTMNMLAFSEGSVIEANNIDIDIK